eukprot:m.236349 g.236349  ORF g.236349 m.236349 type:complete len:89 (+) comp22490_c0_seq4:76-342(+)
MHHGQSFGFTCFHMQAKKLSVILLELLLGVFALVVIWTFFIQSLLFRLPYAFPFPFKIFFSFALVVLYLWSNVLQEVFVRPVVKSSPR